MNLPCLRVFFFSFFFSFLSFIISICKIFCLTEARSLIQQMLTVDRGKRASLNDVLNHPWVNNGYSQIPKELLPNFFIIY